MISRLPAPRLRRLPHTVTPLHHETWDSYVSRLATANRVSHLELHEHINNKHRIHPAPLPLLNAISHLSGHPHDRLLKALPDLRTPDLARHLPAACQPLDEGWRVQAACTLCLAAKGVFTQVRCWVPRSTRLCIRHGRWTDTYHTQFEVRPLPEIIQAQRDHCRLFREHGWQATEVAMRQASQWCWRWWDSRRFHQVRDRRLRLLIPPGGGTYREDPRLIASGYPEIVALTGLLASPKLRNLPFTGCDRDIRQFISEVRERAAPGYRFEVSGAADPLVRWIEEERYYRTLPNHPFPMPNEPRPHIAETLGDLTRRLNARLAPDPEDDRSRCAGCGKSLEGGHPRARFCSPACKARRYRQKRQELALSSPFRSHKECPVCGVTWTPGDDRRSDARYCSHRCRQAAFRQRQAVEDD
ncbi:hypothetical protein ACWFR1_21295 [Streptomyces sp. NPDC055103]